MGASENPPTRPTRTGRRRAALILTVLLMALLLVFALSRLDFSRIAHALITATPGWVALALGLMGGSLLLRSISWHQTLRAALPETVIGWPSVIRSTMIGVMASAVLPGRLGEPTRVYVLTRRLEGPSRSLLPVVAGTVFSQTLINLFALGVLVAVTFSAVPLVHDNLGGAATALLVPLVLAAVVLAGPRLLALGKRSSSTRVARGADAVGRLLGLARRGLTVFASPRFGAVAVTSQLAAWALQWLACYAVLLALGLGHETGPAAAAAILLAVNVSAILPATPSNVGVFQAACLVVLSAYGVGSGPGLAYGIILQAVEVVTALALGVPALLGENLSWNDIRVGPARSPGERAQ